MRLPPKSFIANFWDSLSGSRTGLTRLNRTLATWGSNATEFVYMSRPFQGDGVFGSAVFLVVEDVEALHTHLKAKGVTIDLEPTNQSWGNREIYVSDPDGNSIRFVHGGG
jgi:catechol 2,3-dioxygenase-like lactoylglutathione lyase family enzyme